MNEKIHYLTGYATFAVVLFTLAILALRSPEGRGVSDAVSEEPEVAITATETETETKTDTEDRDLDLNIDYVKGSDTGAGTYFCLEAESKTDTECDLIYYDNMYDTYLINLDGQDVNLNPIGDARLIEGQAQIINYVSSDGTIVAQMDLGVGDSGYEYVSKSGTLSIIQRGRVATVRISGYSGA